MQETLSACVSGALVSCDFSASEGLPAPLTDLSSFRPAPLKLLQLPSSWECVDQSKPPRQPLTSGIGVQVSPHYCVQSVDLGLEDNGQGGGGNWGLQDDEERVVMVEVVNFRI